MTSNFDKNDLVGKRFNKLVVEKHSKAQYRNNGKNFKHFYLCRCDCGNKLQVERQNLKQGHSRSCGCLKRKTGKNNHSWNGYEEISGRIWGHIKNHARRGRKIPFKISIEDAWKQFIKQDRKCALTGKILSFKTTQHQRKFDFSKKTASLDRIDSSKGYELGNIQWVHKVINIMKWSLSNKEFVDTCNEVCKHFENGK